MKRDPNVCRYKDSLKRMGLYQTISEFTHVSDTTMRVSLIDHFITSDLELYSNTGVVAHGATDHFVIYAIRKKVHIKHDQDWYRGRLYGKMDKVSFAMT